MKKLLLAAAAVALLAQPAVAGDLGKHNEGLYLFGGFLGGLVVRDALGRHHHHRSEEYYYEPPPPPRYREVCRTEWAYEWNDAFEEYERVPYTVCRRIR